MVISQKLWPAPPSPHAPGGQSSQLWSFLACGAYWPRGQLTKVQATAVPPSDHDPASHGTQLRVGSALPAAASAVLGGHWLGRQAESAPRLNRPARHSLHAATGVLDPGGVASPGGHIALWHCGVPRPGLNRPSPHSLHSLVGESIPTTSEAYPGAHSQALHGMPPPLPHEPWPHGTHCRAPLAAGFAACPGGQAASRHGASPPAENLPGAQVLQSPAAVGEPVRDEAVPAGQAVRAHCALPPAPHCAGWQLAHAQPSVVLEAWPGGQLQLWHSPGLPVQLPAALQLWPAAHPPQPRHMQALLLSPP
jgi:hypothetical protein